MDKRYLAVLKVTHVSNPVWLTQPIALPERPTSGDSLWISKHRYIVDYVEMTAGHPGVTVVLRNESKHYNVEAAKHALAVERLIAAGWQPRTD